MWTAKKSPNIALIKYMGKIPEFKNQPTNTSLSYTLSHLHTYVTLEKIDGDCDKWECLEHPDCEKIEISKAGQERFLSHLAKIKKIYNSNQSFLVKSANTFPSDCGIASSASSFAALTECAITALCELTHQEKPSITKIADLSRQGSGSSCRSFFEPWAMWDENKIAPIDLPYKKLNTHVLIINKTKKNISSSEAHQIVPSSLLFENRPQRAEFRYQELLSALQSNNWQQAFEITWQEFWDMHALFHTAQPPFSYMHGESIHALNIISDFWAEHKDGPLVTMDAGANIHLLFREDQDSLENNLLNQLQNFKII